MKKYFTDHGNVPRFTKNGYLKVKCPPILWGVIKDVYNILLSLPAEKESVVGNEMVVPLASVFDRFYTEKSAAENDRCNKPTDDSSRSAIGLRGANCHGHGQTTCDQNDGI